jgi:dihydroorotase
LVRFRTIVAMPSLLIHGGRVIDPASGFDRTADVLVVDGRVAAISEKRGELSARKAAKRLDAEGCIVTPGLIDPHVHLREPSDRHEETIATGAAAAINGGFTAVCCMPNTQPPLDTPDLVRLVQHRAEEAKQARVFVAACATKGRQGLEPAAIHELANAGAVAYTDDGDAVADTGVMLAVLRAVKDVGGTFMQHCQEPALTRGAAMNAGPIAERMGQIGWPAVAEEIILERDVRLNRLAGARYHAQHLSSGESAEIIRRARAAGQPVSGEIAPHHLLLTDQACETLGPMAKMNPPLRTAADIAALKEAVADGTVTVLGTDHAPHPISTKQIPFAEASFGIVGLDCALPLYAMALVDDGVLEWPAMLAMMTINAARLLGVDRQGLGALQVGGPADITAIDPAAEWSIDVSRFASAGRNCPFDGWPVRGRAMAVVVGGEVRLVRDAARSAVR